MKLMSFFDIKKPPFEVFLPMEGVLRSTTHAHVSSFSLPSYSMPSGTDSNLLAQTPTVGLELAAIAKFGLAATLAATRIITSLADLR